ncbi:MAG TPA: recombinase family protein [Clostridia bacterium]|nr:recombinase family protein [Clostridia bacterium]
MQKVAAYCRVSTEQGEQLNSLENQKHYFDEYINKNLEWHFVGIYVDEGISGTNVNKRIGFKQMIQDAENKKFDLLLTKEISRFARNTLDSIFYTRKLKALGIGVYFMNDNINTLDPDSELRLTIMASIAQEESRKTSERVKWGHKRQMEKGVVFGTGVYGYHLTNGKLFINEEQAKIVRLIYSLYLDESMGTHILCKELENRGILSPSSSSKWKNASILRMLKNEKYIGTLKQRKEITIDYLSHKKKLNEGEEEYIIIEDNHEAIIDKETFYKVQDEIIRRRTTVLDKSKHSNRYVWSGKVECSHCRAKFKRKIWNGKASNSRIVWQCSNNIKYGSEKVNGNNEKVGCNSKGVHEIVLQEALLSALDSVVDNKQEIAEELKRVVMQVITTTDDHTDEMQSIEADILRLENRKTKLIELYTDNSISRPEFDKTNDQYNKQIEVLRDNLILIIKENEKADDLQQKLSIIDKTIEALTTTKEFSDEICKQVLKKVVVESRDKISFFLTSSESKSDFFIPLSITPYLLLRGLYRWRWKKRRLRCMIVKCWLLDLGEPEKYLVSC